MNKIITFMSDLIKQIWFYLIICQKIINLFNLFNLVQSKMNKNTDKVSKQNKLTIID